jgi:hypothetical protein
LKDCNGTLSANITFCKEAICFKGTGSCELVAHDCSQDPDAPKADNTSCEVIKCSDQDRKCVSDGGDCFALIALVTGLTAGAVAGIVVAAVIAAAVVGGAAAGAAYVASEDQQTTVTANPFFQAQGLSGESAVHVDDTA